MPRVTLFCPTCGHTARRDLMREAGSRGVHETSSEPALCPRGHGLMKRQDGVRQERWAFWSCSWLGLLGRIRRASMIWLAHPGDVERSLESR